ncbi:SUMF1/EgtB/PvdO family nonheme iron enzyme [Roseibium sp.]|uniref:formylglycine-generating enzyme family protein n=1 Tax=Roseibium sp. TaxID=1936156 RepID=UPI003C7E5245
MAKNASPDAEEQTLAASARKGSGMRKQPRIRWADDEDDEFSDMPEVFLRQDAPALSSHGNLTRKYIVSALALTALIGTGTFVYNRSPGDIASKLIVYSKSLFADASPGSTAPPADYDASATSSTARPDLSPELQTKARAALKEAINARQGGVQQTPAPPLPAVPVEIETTSPGTNLEKASAVKAGTPPDAFPPPPAVSNTNPSASEHAAAPVLPAVTSTRAEAPVAPETLSTPAPRLPVFVSVQGGVYALTAPQESGAAASTVAEVELKPFQIARTEVSRRDWLACAEDGACDKDGFPERYFDEASLDLPATSVTLQQINTYIDWLNSWNDEADKPLRLPSEAEWVVAARGGTRHAVAFAWGDRFEATRLEKRHDLVPVSDAPVFNGLAGILDNAEERVSDCWGAQLASGGCFRNLGVVRGAPLGNLSQETARLTHRSSRATSAPYSTVGFRLAR